MFPAPDLPSAVRQRPENLDPAAESGVLRHKISKTGLPKTSDKWIVTSNDQVFVIDAFLNGLMMHQTDGSVTHHVPDVLLEVFKVSVFVARQNWFSNTMV